MKIIVEPQRFKRLISQVIVLKTKPLIESVTGEFTPEGLKISDSSIGAVAVLASFSPKYFIDYKVEKAESFLLSKSIMDEIDLGFKAEKIEISTDGDSFSIQTIDQKEKFKGKIEIKEPTKVPFKVSDSNYGLKPEKMVPIISVLVGVTELQIPSSEFLTISSNGEELSITIRDIGGKEGEYTKSLKINKKEAITNFSMNFDARFFSSSIENLEGDVWLLFDKNALIIAQKLKDSEVSYCIAPTTIPSAQ